MNEILNLPIEEGNIFVEISAAVPQSAVVSQGPIKAGIQSAVVNVLEQTREKAAQALTSAVRAHVALVYGALSGLPEPPTEAEISFGLKFTAEGNIALAKLSGELNYEIKMTWK
jgi:hypothetical protein